MGVRPQNKPIFDYFKIRVEKYLKEGKSPRNAVERALEEANQEYKTSIYIRTAWRWYKIIRSKEQ